MQHLLIYYGWPSLINGAQDLTQAVREFDRYDTVILGAGLEQDEHPDHWRTVGILSRTRADTFGYVDLGVTTSNLGMVEVEHRVDRWRHSGADGVFFDDCGRDYQVDAGRLSRAVWYVHHWGMPVGVNAWDAADVAGELSPGDFYLAEAWQPPFGKRGRRIRKLQALHGFRTFGVNAASYNRRTYRRCLRAAERFGFDGFGWAEPGYHVDSRAPWRGR